RIPRDLDAICLKALAREPGGRYQTAGAFAEDLRRFLAGQPVWARPPGMWERGLKWARRYPAVAALSLGLVLVAAAGFALVTWQWLRAEHLRRSAEAASQEAQDRAAAEEAAKHQAEAARQEAQGRAEAEARAKRQAEEQRLQAQRLSASLALDKG